MSTNKQNFTHSLTHSEKARKFTVSVLSKDTPMELIGHFGLDLVGKLISFENVNYEVGDIGVPIVLGNAIAYTEAEVVNEVDVGTRTIFIGEVMDVEMLQDKEPYLCSPL